MTLQRLKSDLKPVAGVHQYLETFKDLPKCIASSSSKDRLELCLDVLELKSTFKEQVYSASMVKRGKPHSDIFLYTADQLGADPSLSLVIEDSPSGVEAAVAAGMKVIGLLAASHIQLGQGARLRDAGASFVAETWGEAEAFTHEVLEVQKGPRHGL